MFTNKTPWVVLLVLWMGGSTYWHVCRIKQLCPNDGPSSPTVASGLSVASQLPIPDLQFTDGASVSFSSPGHLAFAKSGSDANLNGVRPLLDSLSTYLKSNPGKRLQMTGFYDLNEQNPSTDENLGIARANNIRAYLTSLGLPTSQFLTQGEQKADLTFTAAGDSVYGGIQFAFLDELPVKTAEEKLAKEVKFASIFEPLNLYYNTGQIDYIKTAETDTFLQQTKSYLNANPDQKLSITGHTDNSGSDALNLALSQKRATALKKQFVHLGIADRQIKAEGKGESQPITSNETEEGRRANRRTVLIVKK